MNEMEVMLNQYCEYHPNVETSLRCKRCEKNICSKCAIPTPTGYLCKDCEKTQQKKFDTANSMDYIIAGAVSLILSTIGSLIIPFLGFFVVILAPMMGVIISEVVRYSIKNRRSNQLYALVVIAIAVGAFPWLFFSFLTGNWLSIVFQALYLVFTTSTAYQRLKGIRI